MECRQALCLGTTLSISAPNHQSFGLPARTCAFSQSVVQPLAKGWDQSWPVRNRLHSRKWTEGKPASFVFTASPHGSRYPVSSKTSSGLPVILNYGELYNYFILVVSRCILRNKVHNKCNAPESPWNHPPLPFLGSMFPQNQSRRPKGWGPLP